MITPQLDTVALTPRVDEFVDAFEAARSVDPTTRLAEYLPDQTDPDYEATATELLRVDLELNWQQGKPKRLREYREEYRELLRDDQRFAALAFEEFRLRVESGESIRPVDYQREYEVDTNHWPRVTLDENKNDWQTTVAPIGTASERLVDAIADFPAVGSEFAGFEIERQLGEGCFGRVYLARQAGLAGRPMVLKITAGASGEAHHLARLQHTNIVPIYSVHDQGALRAICMPYLGSRTLASLIDRLHKTKPFGQTGSAWFEQREATVESLARIDKQRDLIRTEVIGKPRSGSRANPTSFERACAEVAAAVANGLAFAHERGIVHRDLKPANILIADDGQPLLLDFNVSEDTTCDATTASVAGTIAYMAPELLANLNRGIVADRRSDIYSVGVIFYQLLTGVHPFEGELADDDAFLGVSLKASRREAPNPQTVNPAIPSDLAAIVQRSLETKLEQRYQSAQQLRDDLDRHLADQPLKHAVDRSVTNRLGKWRRRNPRTLTLAVVAPMLLIMLGAGMLLMKRNSEVRYLQANTRAERLADTLPGMRVDLSGLGSVGSNTDLATLRRGVSSGNEVLLELLDEHLQVPRWLQELQSDKRAEVEQQLVEVAYLLADGSAKLSIRSPDDSNRFLIEAKAHNQLAEFLARHCDAPVDLIDRQRMWIENLSASAPSGMSDQSTSGSIHDIESRSSSSLNPSYLALYDLMSQRRYAKAAEILESIRRESRFDFSAWLLLGDTYLADGRLDDAEACFEAAVSLWPDLDRCYFHRGICRLMQNKFEMAIDDFSTTLKLYPNHLAALLNRGLGYLNTGQLALAEADFSQAIDLGCRQTRVWLLRAKARRQAGDEEGAKADEALALTIPPTDEQSAVAVGNLCLKSDPDRALEYYRLAQHLAPHRRSPRRNIAHVIGEKYGRTAEAIQVLDQLVDDFGKAQDVVARGVLYARIGNREAAIGDAERALAIDPVSAKVQFQVGCIYALITSDESATAETPDRTQSDDSRRAIKHLADAIQRDPRWVQVAARDPDLRGLHRLPHFRSMLAAAMLLEKTANDPTPSAHSSSVRPQP